MSQTRSRTLNFLPEIFKTDANRQFLQATLDQLTSQPNLKRNEGFIGRKIGYGISSKSNYVEETTKDRTSYQLEPGVIFVNPINSSVQDFISYPSIVDSLATTAEVNLNKNQMFSSQFYSWDSFTDLDKLINFHQYYWLPEGPGSVEITTSTVYMATNYTVFNTTNGYDISQDNSTQRQTNPVLTLLRGGTYSFFVNQPSSFWIQGEPGITGFSATMPNVQTREILGVTIL